MTASNPASPASVKPKSDGRFTKGNTVAKKKRIHKRTIIDRVADPKQLESIVRRLLDDAEAGDQFAIRTLISKITPDQRATYGMQKFHLNTNSLEEASLSVLKAISNGEVAPDIGKLVLDGIAATASTHRVGAMAQQLATLTERLERQERLNTPTLTAPPLSHTTALDVSVVDPEVPPESADAIDWFISKAPEA